MKKRGKSYLVALAKIDKDKLYNKEEAVSLIKEINTCRFDASVELAVRLNLDPKKADQQLRGVIVLPHGIGKTKKILAIAKGEQAKIAKKAGADFIGDIDLIAKIEQENWMPFDTIIATPEMMPALSKIGKILGPKGLMPNPKTGTVTMDMKKAIDDVKKGQMEYRTDSFGIVHVVIGKCSFDSDKLLANLNDFMNTIIKIKPSTAKGIYIKNVTLSITMGPSIKINPNDFDK